MIRKRIATTPEPHCGDALPDEQRRQIVEQGRRGKITAAETDLLADDLARATEKARLASKQVAHPDAPEHAVYAAPAIRAESATESLALMQPVITGIAVKYKGDRKRAGHVGGSKKHETAAPRHRIIINAARRLKQADTPDRELVSTIMRDGNSSLSDRQIRTILQKNGLLQKRKRK